MNYKMHKDYFAFNIKLVEAVEKHPCLYNYNLKEYSNREKVQEAWDTISKEFNCSALECKETWKNLRIVYSRNIKKPPLGSRAKKKPYYLLESMNYLKPFMKIDYSSSRNKTRETNQESDAPTTSNEPIRDKETDETPLSCDQSNDLSNYEIFVKNEINSADEYYEDDENSLEPPNKRNKTQRSYSGGRINYANLPTGNSERSTAKHQFLMSLFSDVDDMNDTQFRSFRLEACKLINKILVPPISHNSSWPLQSPSSFNEQPNLHFEKSYPERTDSKDE